MKFTRYLQDTQVPEWKKAYIDYQGLKEHIAAVRGHQETEDRRYRSSIYLGTPARSPVLWYTTTERNNREDIFRGSPRNSLSISRRVMQPHVNTKTVESSYLDTLRTSISASSQSKTLPVPMQEVLPKPKVSEVELEFLMKLDMELDKVERFYMEREIEVKKMLTELRRQLQELKDHQKSFQQSKVEDWRLQLPLRRPTPNPRRDISPGTPIERRLGDRFAVAEWRRAEKKLREAVLEHHKKLDALQNYRTLNLIGFQKVLKKWEKATHMAIQDAYLKEKVEPTAFSSKKVLAELIKDTEDLYTVHFARGDKKRALYHLRAGQEQETHYSAMFRSGVYLGLAMPALASGLYGCYQRSPSDHFPGWGGLLLVYATLFIPVLFSLMVGINVLVWTKLRINYAFIFGLDVKSKIDYQQYIEIPAILLSTLCFSFWLSFSQIGSRTSLHTHWPLIWLGFNTLILCNPFPVCYRSSRAWLFKRFVSLIIAGVRRVEFVDFWMGDQMCSLSFSLTNLYFMGCVYVTGFNSSWDTTCNTRSPHWGIHFLLACSPYFCRLVQSLRRWHDSRLGAHLINAGKYASGMVMYLCYYYWRHDNNGRGTTFALYIVFATIYSIYTCAWDFFADWSILRIRAKYPLLRDEVLSVDYLPMYYFAIITNFVIRFVWIIYLPHRGPQFEVRAFIVAMLEMLRRWQWNFLRLENEHLGNIDQYRVTRDVPLPYTFDSFVDGSDGGDWDRPSLKGWTGRFFKS